jgi:hypothetical protein
MKKLTALILALSLVMTTTISQARENGMDGLILGAGGGALIGQAIGRNTEATLIGTAVGSMLGYIVGNERDKYGLDNRVAYGTPVERYPRTRYVTVVPAPPPKPETVCRESEMLAEIDGRAAKVYGTACLENGEWVFVSPGLVSQTVIIEQNRHPAHYGKINYRKANRHFNKQRFNRPAMYRPVW